MKWFLAGGIILAIVLLLSAHGVPTWGERHTANPAKSLLITTAHPVEQQFTPEHEQISDVAVWLVPGQELPTTGGLLLELTTGTTKQAAVTTFRDVQPDGLAIFSFSPAVSVRNTATSFRLILQDTASPVKIGYQNDGSIYAGGSVTGAAGDTAFQIQYRNAPLSHTWLWVAVLIATAGWIVWQWRIVPIVSFYTYADFFWAALLGLSIALFFAAFLVGPAGQWNSPGDFTKDVSYLQASHQAFRQLTWPSWSLLTCGGVPLLGNPESNFLGLGSVLAFFTSPYNALLWLVSLEAGIGAVGVFLLARAMGISRSGSLLAGVISALGGGYAYRLMEGFTMTGGAVASMPWVILGLLWYIKKQSWGWLWISGTALGFIFLRGEVHILAGFVFLLGILVTVVSVRTKSWIPLLGFITLSCIGLLWASPKLIAYGQQASVFKQDLHPYVTLLQKDGWLADVFFTIHPSDKTVAVLHGESTERWGNFGSFIGLLSLLVALAGLRSRSNYRWWLALSALGIFFIAEGTLYEYGVRFIPELGVLLRLPTRLLSIFVIPLGLLAGMGLDYVATLTSFRLRKTLSVLLVLAVVIDLGTASSTVFLSNLRNRTYTTLPAPIQPTLHQEYSNQLLASGYILPQLCADFMTPPAFAHPDTATWPLAATTAHIQATNLTINNTAATDEFILQTRFSDHWQATGATTLEGPDNTLMLATASTSPKVVQIHFVDSLYRTQAALLGIMIATTLGLGLFPVGLQYFRKLIR